MGNEKSGDAHGLTTPKSVRREIVGTAANATSTSISWTTISHN